MTLPEIRERIKAMPDVPKDVFLVLLFLLMVAIGYIGGRMYALENARAAELRVVRVSETLPENTRREEAGKALTSAVYNVPMGKQYVASKSGKVFHLPWCSGAKRIKEENKIWFSSKEEALAVGLSPASNCEGI